jgi:hypothetical protein
MASALRSAAPGAHEPVGGECIQNGGASMNPHVMPGLSATGLLLGARGLALTASGGAAFAQSASAQLATV